MKSNKEWLSISDMMTGLMMVFLFISVVYMESVVKKNQQEKTKNKSYIESAKKIEELKIALDDNKKGYS